MKSASVKRNYLYNLLFQILSIAIPIITTPYIARTIGEEGIGIYSYTYNNISYLIMIGNFGIGLFATRQIAYDIDSEETIRKDFWSVIYSRNITFVIPVIVFFLIIAVDKQYRVFYLIEAISIVEALLDTSWFYNGQENFRITVVRGIFIKIACLILIFALVRSEEDLGTYIFLVLIGQLLGSMILFGIAFKMVGYSVPEWWRIKRNIRGAAIIFIPQLASSLYYFCDKIMIRFLSAGIAENGYYEQSQRIIRLSITVITALPTVMLPRVAAEYGRGNDEKLRNYIFKTLQFVVVVATPMTFGLIGVSDTFVPWFLGDRFIKVNILLKAMAPIIFFNSIYNVICYQYFVATKKEKKLACIILIGSIINITLNALLIPKCGSLGASIASAISEMIMAAIMCVVIAEFLSFNGLLRTLLKAVVGSILMMCAIIALGIHLGSSVASTVGLMLLGVLTYVVIMILEKEETVTRLVVALMKGKTIR